MPSSLVYLISNEQFHYRNFSHQEQVTFVISLNKPLANVLLSETLPEVLLQDSNGLMQEVQ